MKKKILLLLLIGLLAIGAHARSGKFNDSTSIRTTDLFLAPLAQSTTNVVATINQPSTNIYNPMVFWRADGAAADFSITQPVMAMTLRVAVSDNLYEASTGMLRGEIYLYGRDARNNIIKETLTVISGNASYTDAYVLRTQYAFGRLESIGFDSTWNSAVSINDTLSIGTDDKVGLTMPIGDWDDVYKIEVISPNIGVNTVDNYDLAVTTVNVNPSGNRYDDLTNSTRLSVFKPPYLVGDEAHATPCYKVTYSLDSRD